MPSPCLPVVVAAFLVAGAAAQAGSDMVCDNSTYHSAREGIHCHEKGTTLWLDDDACEGKCDGKGWECIKVTTRVNGRIVTTDYRDAHEHTTGLLAPIMYTWSKSGLAVVLCLFLLYLFLGVAVVADQFMVAIEVITSKKKKLTTTDIATGETVEIEALFWNPTVANLSLLALGSSAPEILLACIETVSNLGEAPGELGASTIVGSAAFNLLVISAVCIICVPTGEVRTVTQVNVFICTSLWSLFAYIWLVIILEVWTPDEVTLIEAVLTLLFFPALLISSFYVDKAESRSNMEKHRSEGGDWVGGSDAKEMQALRVMTGSGDLLSNRHEIAQIIAAAQQQGGDTHAAAKAVMQLLPPPKITRIQARINAAKSMAGKKHLATADVTAEDSTPTTLELSGDEAAATTMHKMRGGGGGSASSDVKIAFQTPTVIGKESTKLLNLTVMLSRSSPTAVSVDYRTVDGTAEADKDYRSAVGTLTFQPGQTSAEIPIELIEDDEFEPDETFTVQLSNPRGGSLGLSNALCLIVDDHEPGQLGFSTRFYTVKESEPVATIPVERTYGSHGRVTVDYATSNGVAVAGTNYAATKGTLVFEDGETVKEIVVKIILDVEPEQNMNFCVNLSNPEGGASLSKANMSVVTILDDEDIEEVTDMVAQLLAARDHASHPQGGWKEQFVEAVQCEGSVDHLGQEIPPGAGAMLLHCFSLPWKLLFATIPPTGICNGWATFIVALIYIGIITAVVGDVAGQLGEAMGLKPLVTAISFVALGTSLPDLFASKQAVTDGTDADAAVGNVTGSNSVNVFLGLGVPYVIAAIYYNSSGDKFCVPAGSLAFSVIVFSACAVFCIGLLFYRRRFSGGELGGSTATKWFHFTILVALWCLYLTLSTLKAYDKLGSSQKASRCSNE